jgi:hypothetical protein
VVAGAPVVFAAPSAIMIVLDAPSVIQVSGVGVLGCNAPRHELG